MIDSIPASAQVVSPAFMAGLQGRGHAGPLASIRLTPAAATIVAGGSQQFQVEGFDANGQDIGDVTGQAGFAIDGGGSCSGPVCGAGAAGGYTVTTTDGAFTDSAQLTVVDPPQVAGLAPVIGAAGDAVTITGTGLDTVTAVSFNGAAAAFQVDRPGQITAVVPVAASDGPVSLTALGGVTVPAGTFAVQPRIDSFAPQTAAPGATVAITGSGFIGATGVTVAGVAAAYTVVSANQITATVPAGAGTEPHRHHPRRHRHQLRHLHGLRRRQPGHQRVRTGQRHRRQQGHDHRVGVYLGHVGDVQRQPPPPSP